MRKLKRWLAAMMVGSVLAGPAHAVEVDIGGSFKITGFSVDDTNQDSGPLRQGYQQRTRLAFTLGLENNIRLISAADLRSGYWYGDPVSDGDSQTGGVDVDGDGVPDFYQETRPDAYNDEVSPMVTLDHAYLEFPLLGGMASVGRQKANWASCFVSCDDRRDRLKWVTRVGNTRVIAALDKRDEGDLGNNKDDGDQWIIATVGRYGGWYLGLLGSYFSGDENDAGNTDGYVLSQAKLFSPHVVGRIGPVKVESAFNYIGDGVNGFYEGTHTSEFLRLGWSASALTLEAQVAAVQNGGLVSGGFDTYSSLINNSPDYEQSPTTVALPNPGPVGAYRGLGGLGLTDVTDELDQLLVAARVGYHVTDALRVTAAWGQLDQENTAPGWAGPEEATDQFYDLQAAYRMAQGMTFTVTAGQIRGDMFDTATDTNDPYAVSATLAAEF